MFKLTRAIVPLILLTLAADFACAAGEGQDDLDKATDAKLNATTIGDLGEVIRLSESALAKGLDPANTEFANRLLASTSLQRAQEIVKQVVGSTTPADFVNKRQFALSDLERAVKLDPKQSQAHLLIAQLNLLPGGDAKLAREAVDKAIQLGADDPLAHAKALAVRAGLQEDLDKKLADLGEAVRLVPKDPNMVRARGLLLADMGKPEQALVDLDKAIELEPDNAPTYEAKVIVLVRMKKLDEARKVAEKLIQLGLDNPPAHAKALILRANLEEKPDKKLADLDEAVRLVPKDANMVRARGLLLADMGKPEQALVDLDKATELDPKSGPTYEAKAIVLARLKKFDEALAALDKAQELNPESVMPLVLRASVHTHQDKIDAAIEDINQAVRMEPRNTGLLLQLAALYGAQKHSPKAIEIYTTLLDMDPNSSVWQALRGRGDAYLNIGKHAEAIADYEKALKLQPKEPGLLNNFAWVLATSPDDNLRNGRRAIELATLASEATEHKVAHILSTLAAAYAETGDFQSAIKWSSKAVEIGDKENADALKKELESFKAQKPWRELLSEQKPAEK